MTTPMNNRSDKEMIRDFTESTTDLKSRGTNPVFRIINTKASTVLKKTVTTTDLNFQLVPPSNHIAKDSERSIQTFKNHFIAGLCSVDADFQLQLWYIMLQ